MLSARQNQRSFLTLSLVAMAAAGACGSNDTAGLSCPILAPGSLAGMTWGQAIPLSPESVVVAGTLPESGVIAHAVAVPDGVAVQASLSVAGEQALLLVYGPRDEQGGFPTCAALSLASDDGASVGAQGEVAAGEHVLLVGARPGRGGGRDYQLKVTCAGDCGAAPTACPTLQAQGCGDVRCDGLLDRDDAGCLTCACRSTTFCPAGLRAGPWGTCVSPGCTCPTAGASETVCGSDGASWPSGCEARCAGVSVLFAGACTERCGVLECDNVCRGPRAVASDTGCPTCACADDPPSDTAQCAACPEIEAPVCGSGGRTHRNRCEAFCAGARVLYSAACVGGCVAAPAGCDLDCPYGLELDGTGCVSCACVKAPASACRDEGRPVCAELPGLGTTTVGATCLATHLGASDPTWGPCGAACETDSACTGGATCLRDGPLAGRCVLPEPTACGCSALVDPVCGEDGQDYANSCLAACAGVGVDRLGACGS